MLTNAIVVNTWTWQEWKYESTLRMRNNWIWRCPIPPYYKNKASASLLNNLIFCQSIFDPMGRDAFRERGALGHISFWGPTREWPILSLSEKCESIPLLCVVPPQRHLRVPLTIPRDAASCYVFQYIIEKIFLKCRQTSNQIAMDSPQGTANYISLL